MKTICCLNDLREFGIEPLTGEADSLGFRVLCDLTTRGAKIVSETFGLTGKSAFPENWNCGSKDVPHIGSVMLAHDAYTSIGVIALVDAGCHTIIATENSRLIGLENEEKYTHAEGDWSERGDDGYPTAKSEWVITKPARLAICDHEGYEWSDSLYGKVRRVYQFGSGPRVGTRNVHAMSGRAV